MLPLADRFVLHFNHEFGKSIDGIDARAKDLLAAYPWPGNVRELRNAIERSVLLTEGGRLTAGDLPAELRGGAGGPAGADGRGRSATEANAGFTLPEGGVVLEEVEKELVRQALERTGGNRSRAARLLGMNRDQIRYRIDKFDLEPEKNAASK